MKKILLATAVSTALMASNANADLRINGFANFTAGKINDDIVSNTGEPSDLFGYTTDLDFSNGSLFAIQISGDVNEKVSATAQIVARGSEDYSAEFQWAYLSYAASDNTTLSAGRFRVPLFRYSASSDVGYSYHWVAAPQSVYDVTFSNLDGVRVDYSNYSGDLEYVLQVAGGTFKNEIGGGEIKGNNVLVASAEGTYGSFKGRLVVGRGTNNFNQPLVNSTLASIEQVSPEIAELMALENDTGKFLGLGLEYDNFDWFVSGELTSVATEQSFSPEDKAYYVTAGIRLGKFTPSITVEARDGREDFKFLDKVAQLSAPLQAPITQAVVGLQSFFHEDYEMLTVGVRYDMDASIAIKADLTQYEDNLNTLNDTSLVRVAVNYVF